MTIDSKRPLKVRDKDGELYVYTNRWIKIDEELQGTRSTRRTTKKVAKTKK